ncbi:Os12g0516400, partial [Oryza sativa Japonica Group]
VSWEARRCDRRGTRLPCPAAATGGAWRRPAAGPDGAVVQAGSRAARARRVEEAALLLPRHTSRFRRPQLHDGFQRPSPHPEPAPVGRPLRRRREVTPPPGFVQGRSHWWLSLWRTTHLFLCPRGVCGNDLPSGMMQSPD